MSVPLEVPVKLFVGRFPRSFTDSDLEGLFSGYGRLMETTVLRDAHTGDSKGCGFVRFASVNDAVVCVREMNNKEATEAGPLQVQFANGEIERLGLSPDQVETPPVKLFVGSVPDSWTESDLSELFSQHGTVCEVFILAGKERRAGFVKMSSRDGAMSAITALNNLAIEGSENNLEVRMAVSRLQRSRMRRAPILRPQVSVAGPPGCNVFVFHFPHDWTEYELRQIFAPFGFIISATLARDRITGLSKGYAFVSYDNPFAAKAAVVHMNGYVAGSKRLKVQLKHPNGDIPSSGG